MRPGRYVVLAVGDSGSGLDGATQDDAGRATAGPRARRTRSRDRRSASSGSTAAWCGCRARRGRAPRSRSTCRGSSAEALEAPAADAADADALRGRETVLVAEDEDGVRELLRKVLTEFGYTRADRPSRPRRADAGGRHGGARSTCW